MYFKGSNISWYRISKDLELLDGTSVKIYRTVFETSDYALSEESVEWCRNKLYEEKEGKNEQTY